MALRARTHTHSHAHTLRPAHCPRLLRSCSSLTAGLWCGGLSLTRFFAGSAGSSNFSTFILSSWPVADAAHWVVVIQKLSRVRLFAIPWTVAHQASLSTEFRQEYWSGLPCPPPGDLPNLGLLHCRWTLYCLSHQRQSDFFMSEAVEGSLNLENPGRSGRTGFFVSHL